MSDQEQYAAAESFRANAQNLMQEGFKAESILKMMNNCSDKCELSFRASGIQETNVEEVSCFKNCITMAYKLSNLNLDCGFVLRTSSL